jgi:hypothetical protein
VRPSRAIVRPGSKKGATILVFKLKRGARLQFTVVRVHPSCEVVGRFSVPARAGLNRVRFRGRVGGRPLAAGTYRLLVRARGARRYAAAVTLVVASNGWRPSDAKLRAARRANACNDQRADSAASTSEGAAAESGGQSGAHDAVGKNTHSAAPLFDAAIAGLRKSKALGAATGGLVREAGPSRILLALGLLTLLSALMGAGVLAYIARHRADPRY